jgi:hypothetical protein
VYGELTKLGFAGFDPGVNGTADPFTITTHEQRIISKSSPTPKQHCAVSTETYQPSICEYDSSEPRNNSDTGMDRDAEGVWSSGIN